MWGLVFMRCLVMGLVVVAALGSPAVFAADVRSCLSDVAQILSRDEWRLRSPVERLSASSFEHVKVFSSASFKRTRALEADAHTFARYRVDELVFDEVKNIAHADQALVQVYGVQGGATAVFPARRFYRDTQGMNFSSVSWDYAYAIYRAFRVSNQVYIVYTDAALFSDGLEPFADQIRAIVVKQCVSDTH